LVLLYSIAGKASFSGKASKINWTSSNWPRIWKIIYFLEQLIEQGGLIKS
jgi:hypothetical protein